MSSLRTLGIVFLLSACTGDDGSADAAAPAGEGAGQQMAEYAQEACDRLRYCCSQAGFEPDALEDCEAEAFATLDVLQDGKIRIVEPAYSECLAQQQAEGDRCEIRHRDNDICLRVFEGTVNSGGACRNAGECFTNGVPSVCLRASGALDTVPGVCRQLERAAEGEGCIISVSDDVFAVPYGTARSEAEIALAYCHYDDGMFCGLRDGKCRKFLTEGMPCDNSGPDLCVPEQFYCEGTCKPRKPAGTACTTQLECAFDAIICRDGVCSVPTIADLGGCTAGP